MRQNSDKIDRIEPWYPLHYLPKTAESILDIGCNVGGLLQYAHTLGVQKLRGIDINPQSIEVAKERLAAIPDVKLVHGSADSLAFVEDTSVDVITCCEVMEHIPQDLRPSVVKESHRVLKQGGVLILTTPAHGLFSFLDQANFRFLFPFLYSKLSRLIGGKGREDFYKDQKHGIVWHHHFRLSELEQLFGNHFNIELIRWRGCVLTPVCGWLQFPFYRLNKTTNPMMKTIDHVLDWEMSINAGEFLAYNVLLVARKTKD